MPKHHVINSLYENSKSISGQDSADSTIKDPHQRLGAQSNAQWLY